MNAGAGEKIVAILEVVLMKTIVSNPNLLLELRYNIIDDSGDESQVSWLLH